MKTKINVKDIMTLIFWIQTFYIFDHREFKHQKLFDKALSMTNDSVDTDVFHIDDLMIDAYEVYVKMEKVNEHIDMLDMFNVANIKKDEVISETKKYFDIFQDFIENYKYDNPKIREIQHEILTDKMLDCVKVEDYETAAKYRDLINES